MQANEIAEIARQAARNLERRLDLQWSSQDREDAAQWAALGIVEAQQRIAAAANPERYAYGVAQREVIERMVRPRRVATTPMTWEMAHAAPDAIRERDPAIWEGFSAEERAVLMARVEDGLTRGQIAERFGIGFWDVHRILQRCRARLSRKGATQ